MLKKNICMFLSTWLFGWIIFDPRYIMYQIKLKEKKKKKNKRNKKMKDACIVKLLIDQVLYI